MIKDIEYAFNKKDYFTYFFIFIFIFILINKADIFNTKNVISLLITLGILYLLLKKKINNEFSGMEKQNNKLKKINVDRYRFLRKDVQIIDCIIKLQSLAKIDRVKFNKFLTYSDRFFMYYEMSKAKNLKPSDLYTHAYDNSKRAINTLLSFVIELDFYGYLDKDRTIVNDKYFLINNNLTHCIDIIKDRFSVFLTEIEKNINKDWLDGDINIYSKPIYPDDLEYTQNSDILFSDKYNIQ